jgi:predicted transcriptional regulator
MVRPRLWAKGREIEMPTAKKQALEMVKKLPDKARWDDIMYEIYVRKKIAAGIHAADEGRVVPHETVRKRFIKK